MATKRMRVVGLMLLGLLGSSQVCQANTAEMERLSKKGLKAEAEARYPQALATFQQGLKLARQAKNKPAQWSFLSNIGLVYWTLGQYDQALAHLQPGLAITREIKDRQGEGNILTNIGAVYLDLGQYDQALAQFQPALAIHKEMKDRRGEGGNLTNIGLVYRNLGQLDKALAYSQQALAIKREIKDLRGVGGELNNIGIVYAILGQYDQALTYYQQALSLDRENKDRQGVGADLSNIGLVYAALGQYDQALAYYQQALAINRAIKVRQMEGTNLGNMGVAYWNLDQNDQALAHYQQALAIKREIKDRRGEGDVLGNIGVVYAFSGQYDQALTYFQPALAISREIKDRQGEGTDLNNIGNVYLELGQYDQAREIKTQSLLIAQEVGDPQSLWKAQRGLGAAEAKLAQDTEAIKHYEQALDTIESMRGGLQAKEARSSFMQDKLYVYDELIELLRSRHEQDPSQGYDRKSWDIFERKQGRQFLEEMGKSGARTFAGLPDEIKKQEGELENRLDTLQAGLTDERSKPEPNHRRIEALESELQQTKTSFQTLKEQLQTTYPDYYALKYPRPASLTELQTKVLQPGEVLLVYGVMEDKICLWVIGKELFRLHTLPMGEKDLGKKIAACRQTFLLAGGEDRGVAGERQKAAKEEKSLPQELYRLLVPPQARSALPAGSRLYIIPTGPLYALPFEALETQAAGQPPHYLVEDYAIAYLSSASLLRTLREAQARKQAQPPYPLLAFANPRYETISSSQTDDKSVRGLQTRAYREILGGSFSELPETEDEARAIKDLLKAPEQSNPLIVKEAASRSTVFSLNQAAKLRDYRYLVFACHGILPGEVDRVVQPALVLAFPEKDGFLTMADVFGLRLNAGLVSLSACNTGRGSQVKGEGVMGLTRAFMFAGTPAVSVTLWSVESQSAKELNVGMYRYLSQKHGRAAALREIKLALLRGEKGNEYRNPFFWAPLVVFGDGQ